MKQRTALGEELQSLVDEARAGLKGRQLYKVASATGLSYPTLKKLLDGEEHNFTIDTLQTVIDYLQKD